VIEEKTETKLVGFVSTAEMRETAAYLLRTHKPLRVAKCDEYANGIYLTLANGQKFDVQIHDMDNKEREIRARLRVQADALCALLDEWESKGLPAGCPKPERA